MKEIYKIGGYVRCIKPYDCAKVGDILEITNYGGYNHLNAVHVVNEKGETTLLNTTFDSRPECEWVGMEKPQEIKSSTEEVKIENWVPKTGEYAVMIEAYGGAKAGEVVKILDRQTDLECHYVENLNGEGCGAPYWKYMRPALPHEIPQKQAMKTEEWQPKVGEYAYVEKTGICAISVRNFSVGDVFEITRTEISHNEHYDYLWLHTKKGTICKASCRCALPHEIPQQKVDIMETYTPRIGDWVWAKPNIKPSLQLGQIKSIRDTHYGIFFIDDGTVLNTDRQDWSTIRKARPEEIPHTGAPIVKEENMESLLKEAKRRYKIGDRIKCAHNPSNELKVIGYRNYRDGIGNSNQGYLYFTKKGWAEIIEKAETNMEELLQEAEKRFPIGSVFIPYDMGGKEYTVHSDGNYHIGCDGKNILVKTTYGSGQYLYYDGVWAKKIEGVRFTDATSGDSHYVMSADPISSKKCDIPSNGVEKMPGEIIVKRKEKVGRRLIMV